MQQLYANTISYPFDLKVAQQQLERSNTGFFELYLLLLNMFIEVQACGRSLHKLAEKQYLKANSNQLNPKFFSNQAIAKLSNSKILESKTAKFKVNYWEQHDEYVRLIWDQIAASDRYATYISENEIGFINDKAVLIDLFTNVIAPYERLHELIEEIKPSWVDDYPLAYSNHDRMNELVDQTRVHHYETMDFLNFPLGQYQVITSLDLCLYGTMTNELLREHPLFQESRAFGPELYRENELIESDIAKVYYT